jgi:hypothetical protein
MILSHWISLFSGLNDKNVKFGPREEQNFQSIDFFYKHVRVGVEKKGWLGNKKLIRKNPNKGKNNN